MSHPITHLFLDIGGVLATNGWDHSLRDRTAKHFGVDPDELNERHHLTYDTYESGKMSLALYLDRVMFYEPRAFSRDDVIQYILNEAKPYPEMIALIREVRQKCGLKIAVVSNEGRELAIDRIARFKLGEFVDFFVISAFVHFRKPDTEIFRLALDIAQADSRRTIYIEDRHMFVEVAQSMGLYTIQHRNVAETRAALAKFGVG